MTLRTPKPHNGNKPADKSKPSLSNDPNDILYLQRTIGNHAVNQLLKSQKPVITKAGEASVQLKIQRKLMSYNKFIDYTGQRENPKMRDVYEGTAMQAELDASRKAIHPEGGGLRDDFAAKTNINQAYFEATVDERIETLTNLHDTIVYWQTLFGHLPGAAGQKSILDGILNVTNQRVQKLIAKENKKQDKFGSDLLDKGKSAVKSAKDSVLPGRRDAFHFDDSDLVPIPEMPESLKRVGVPHEYFIENFVDLTTGKLIEDRAFYLDALIRLLEGDKGRNQEQASATFDDLEAMGLKDFYLLKSVVFSHFGIVLDKIVGTDRDATIGQQLTQEEAEAIIKYSGGAYKAINTEARAAVPRATPKLQPGVRPGTAAPVRSYRRDMELAVSGLNKLPKYQGKLYRGLAKPPPGFAAYAQEGAVTGDLGFSSATPAITAVYDFLSNEIAPGNIIYVIQSKTGTNILSLSVNVQEGEVLFRPGTRFQITKIWKHTPDGKIPEDAPADVQMILHKKGEYVNKTGGAMRPKDTVRFQTQIIMITEI
ncbi:MAG: hypothetical protein ABI690_06785 [Chloroflexota bacterium]